MVSGYYGRVQSHTSEVDSPGEGVPFGKYRIVRKLGNGAVGTVYEALLPGPLGFAKRVAIALGVCRGLHHAHRLRDHDGLPLRLVHRDLKPSNIIVNRGGTPKILDFGIAKATSNLVTTTTGASIKGTPRYMSPEQITGNNSLDPRSDLFSLGAILYELITLRPAFEADSVLTLAYRIVAGDTRDLIAHGEDVFPGSGAILGSLLTKRPEDRYPDARALSEDVRELGRSYPAEADMAEVMGRMLPAAERPGVRAVRDVGELARDDSETPDLMGFDEPLALTLGSSAPGTGGWNRFVSHFDELDASLDPDEDASTMSMQPPIPPEGLGGSEPAPDAVSQREPEGSSGIRWLPAWAVESVIPLLPEWAVRPLERGRRLRTTLLLSLALATAVLAVVFVADPSLGMEMASVLSRAWGVPDVGFPFP